MLSYGFMSIGVLSYDVMTIGVLPYGTMFSGIGPMYFMQLALCPMKFSPMNFWQVLSYNEMLSTGVLTHHRELDITQSLSKHAIFCRVLNEQILFQHLKLITWNGTAGCHGQSVVGLVTQVQGFVLRCAVQKLIIVLTRYG